MLADAALVASVPGVRRGHGARPWSVLRSGAMSPGSPAAGEPGGRTVAAQAGRRVAEATGALARRLLDEHRLVTSVFLALPDMGVPRDGAARLQDYLRVALPVIRRYDGELRQVDAGDKGYQLVIGFGAPRTAADDAERAVGCCLELVRLPAARARAGVATGPAFCAEVGTPDRREYVVIGDSVNVAARLAHVGSTGRGPHRRRHLASLRGLRPSTPAGAAAGQGTQRPGRGLLRGGAPGDDARSR